MTTQSKSPRDKPSIRVVPPKLFGMYLLAGIALNFIFPLPVLPARAALAAGMALAGLGLALGTWSFRAFRLAETSFRIDRPASRIVDTGPFAFSRNPIYIAFAMIHAGIALLFNAGWALLFLVPVLWIMRLRVILKEEEYLAKKFGPAYAKYCRKVRRWL